MTIKSAFVHATDGHLYWVWGPKSGDRFGSLNEEGFLEGEYLGKCKLEHSLVWEFYNGAIPDRMEVEHINHIKCDNRLSNLRLASSANCCNRIVRPDSKLGIKGVSIYQGLHYRAGFMFKGRRYGKYFPLTPEGLASATAWLEAKRVEVHNERNENGTS
jgi:hypothetical protein